jgi:DNA polymerase III epsilon subunit-like protein
MKNNYICVFDFETSSSRKSDTEIVQIAAVILDPATLQRIEGAEFESLMRPSSPEALDPGAVQVHKKTWEILQHAPHPEEVWNQFATWLGHYYCGNRSEFNAPIAAGHNILGFDLPIAHRYCHLYGPTKTEKNGEVIPRLFQGRLHYDTMQMLNIWWEGMPDSNRLSLDFLRKYFDMPVAIDRDAHDALRDVYDTAAIVAKLLKLHRRVAPTVIWEGCFNETRVEAEKSRRQAIRDKQEERKSAGPKREKSYV